LPFILMLSAAKGGAGVAAALPPSRLASLLAEHGVGRAAPEGGVGGRAVRTAGGPHGAWRPMAHARFFALRAPTGHAGSTGTGSAARSGPRFGPGFLALLAGYENLTAPNAIMQS
jgi:hypothetical protein